MTKLKLSAKEIMKLKSFLVDWEDDNISDYEYCNKVGKILSLGGWTGKGCKRNRKK